MNQNQKTSKAGNKRDYPLLDADGLKLVNSQFIRRDLKLPLPNGNNPEVVTETRWLQFLYQNPETINDNFEVTSRYSYYLDESHFEVMAWFPLEWIANKEDSHNVNFELFKDGQKISSQLNNLKEIKRHRIPTVLVKIESRHLDIGENSFIYQITFEVDRIEKGVVTVARKTKNQLGATVQVDKKNWQLIINGERDYLYGWYRCDNHNLEHDVEYGVNVILTEIESDYQEMKKQLDYLHSINVRCFLGHRNNHNIYGYQIPTKEHFNECLEGFIKEVTAFKDHPAVIGHYLADEPCGSEQFKPLLNQKLIEAKKIAPYHIYGVVFMSVSPFQIIDEIADNCDFLSIDTYHVPGSIKQNGRDCKFYKNYYRKFFFTVPQMFGGSEWWSREPTPAEYRVQTWLELVEGSELLLFFRRDYNFPRDPESRNLMLSLASQFRRLDGFLVSEETPPLVSVVIKDSAHIQAGKINTSSQSLDEQFLSKDNPLISELNSGIETMYIAEADNPRYLNNRYVMAALDHKMELNVRAYRHREVVMVIVVNPQNIILPFSLSIEKEAELEDFAILPFEDNRTVLVKHNQLQDVIEGYGVRIYHIHTTKFKAMSEKRVKANPNNLQEDASYERGTGLLPTNMYSDRTEPGKRIQITCKEAAHGLYSLYLDLRNKTGFKGLFNENYFDNRYKYPVKISCWAKAKPVSPKDKVIMSLGARQVKCKDFELNSEWNYYEYTFDFEHDNSSYGYSRWNTTFKINDTPAEVWLDLFEVEIIGFDNNIKPSHYMAMTKRPITLYYDDKGVLIDPSTDPNNLKSEKDVGLQEKKDDSGRF